MAQRLNFNEERILAMAWFSPGPPNTRWGVGVVAVRMREEPEKWSAYIGTYPGFPTEHRPQEDAVSIAEWGVKLTEAQALVMMDDLAFIVERDNLTFYSGR